MSGQSRQEGAMTADMINTEATALRDSQHLATEEDNGSGSSRSPTLVPDQSSPIPSPTGYATHRELINSSDTLRLIPSPDSTALPSPQGYRPRVEMRQSEETICQEIDSKQVDTVLTDSVALSAAKGAEQTISTKRAVVASLSSPQKTWDIIQGRRDEQVEEQVSALGLKIRMSEESAPASDISRTPSQSTTGTESSTSGSFATGESSLQSSHNSDMGRHEKELPSIPLFEPGQSRSPNLYVTACSSHDDLLQQRRNHDGSLRRYHALLELVETERGYAEDLSTLVNVFFHNLTTQAFFDENEARLKAVCRNTNELLELHLSLARKLSKIIDDCQISQESSGSDMEKALKCEEAVQQVAQQLAKYAPRFEHYQLFCSRHAEALILIREAEKRHNGDDFAAYERMCGNQMRGHSKTSSKSQTPSRRSSAGSSTPLAVSALLAAAITTEETSSVSQSTPVSGSTTPSGSFASVSRRTTGRLLFADYLIKPIQRLCLYPLVLNSLLKFTPEEEILTRQSLEAAIGAMRKIADDVDKASKQRERDLMADLLFFKIEAQPGLPSTFIKTLGNPSLSGALDVFYHGPTATLIAPLRFQRLGLIIWNGFLLVVRVRKNQQLECKHWLPLASARLSSLEETVSPSAEIALLTNSTQLTKPLVPFAMRISFHSHHLELSASNEKERQIWHSHLTRAIEEAPSVLESYPCSFFADASTSSPSTSESFISYFANNTKTTSSAADSLVRLPSPSARIAVDRNMIFSEELLTQAGFNAATSNSGGGYGPVPLTQKDFSDALIMQQLRQNSTPSIGSAVGAAMGLARMAATQVPTAVKRSRRQSLLNLTEIKPTCDALLIDSPGELSPTSNINPFSQSISKRSSMSSFKNASNMTYSIESGDSSSNNKWRNSLLRRNSKVMSVKNAGGSMPPSPMTSTFDLNQSLKAGDIPRSASPFNIDSTTITNKAKPLHERSKSVSLRDVWQNSIGRRSRSHSINYGDVEVPNSIDTGIASPQSALTSQTSSPVLEDDDEMRFGSRTTIDQTARLALEMEGPSTADYFETPFRNRLASLDSAGSASIAQLRKILNATSIQSSATLTRAKASGSRFLLSGNNSNDGSSSSVQGKSRAKVERSKTELTYPVVTSTPTYNQQDRRRSEPDALHIETRSTTIGVSENKQSSFTLSATNTLRRLGRRTSLIGPSSPASSVVNFSNSNLSTPWSDHSRLNSVEEHSTEVNETFQAAGSNTNSSKTNKEDLPIRPQKDRRRSMVES